MQKSVIKSMILGIMATLALSGCGGGGSTPVVAGADTTAGGTTPVANVTTPPDGSALYADNCAGCHNSLATSTKKGRTADQIRAAITANRGGMRSISLTDIQVQAIATALAGTTTPPSNTATVAISTASMAAAAAGTAYSQSLAATGGTSPYTWSVTTGALPGGLSLSGGVISGTPTTAGTYSITVKATDSATPAGTVSKTFSIVVNATTAPAPNGAALYAANCAGCHNSLASSSKKGKSATQIGDAITANRGGMGSISLTDVQLQAIATALAVTTTATPVVISTASLAAATAGTAYSQSLAATGGTSPYTWSVTAGALPGGLSLAGGVISGTPTTAGTYSITVRANDSATPVGTVSKTFSIVVNAAATPPPALDGATLYTANCADCHRALASTSKRGRTAAQIKSAITSNRGGMGSISLTDAEIAAIAAAIQ